MARVKTQSTDIERLARRHLTANGVHYRLNVRALPGTPDIYIGRLKLAIFTHGCFWHGHACARGRLPHRGRAFWQTKIQVNRERDARVKLAMRECGIGYIEWWGCEARLFEQKAEDIGRLYAAASSTK